MAARIFEEEDSEDGKERTVGGSVGGGRGALGNYETCTQIHSTQIYQIYVHRYTSTQRGEGESNTATATITCTAATAAAAANVAVTSHMQTPE
jgi:hypothetical protein